MNAAGFPLLSLLTFLPLVGCIVIMTVRGDEATVASNARWTALWTSLIVFALSLILWVRFDQTEPGFQFMESVVWLPDFHIGYKMGVDGISVLFVLLSTLLTPICILASWESVQTRVREYMIAFLVLETMMVGMFCAMDFIVFYMFFEGVLIPMFLIIGIWGGARRVYAALKFFLFTLTGSVLMLLALLAMWYLAGTTDIPTLMRTNFPVVAQNWLFLAFFAAFAVKVPMWPVHTWLPDAHVEAPTAGSVILAGVLLKMGAYGFLRFSVPMLPHATMVFAPFIYTLSVVAVIYTSAVALAQEDMKKLIAYSSIAHMGVVTIGIFTVNVQGLQGALFQMLSHGVVSGALFLCVGVIYDRMHTREIARYGGLAARMPLYAVVFMVFTMASIGLPGTAGFVGEILVIIGSFQVSFWLSLLGGLGMILGAGYGLYLYRRVIFGKLTREDLMGILDLSPREVALFAPLILITLWMGVYPASFTSFFTATVTAMVEHHQAALETTTRLAGNLPLINWSLALPEIVLAICGLAILLIGVIRGGENTFLCSMLSLGAFLLTAMLVLSTKTGGGYGGLFVADSFSAFVQVLILVAGAFAVLMSIDYNRMQGIGRFEFPVLMVFAVVGMLIMASASNLMTLYLGLELNSLSVYVLAAFARDELRSAEAGLKYFVLGSLASGLLLYGISLIYGFSGTMDFTNLVHAMSDPTTASAGLIVGVVFVIAGLAFKISAVPFHMWTPDVYEGAPTSVTAFMGTAPKVAAMAVLLRTMATPFGHLLPQWQSLIELVSIASMLLGSFAAIGQTSIKRLMAYSSIGHMGYALIGLAVGTAAGVRGTLIYLVTYVFMSIGTFAVIIAMRRKGVALEKIADLAGLGRTDPLMAMALAVFMFSMAGIPPMSGFFGKLYVFLPAVQSGMWTIAIIGVLTSVVGAYYYLRVIKVMYFDAGGEAFDAHGPSLSFAAAASGLFTLLFFVFPGPIVGAAQTAAQVLFR